MIKDKSPEEKRKGNICCKGCYKIGYEDGKNEVTLEKVFQFEAGAKSEQARIRALIEKKKKDKRMDIYTDMVLKEILKELEEK